MKISVSFLALISCVVGVRATSNGTQPAIKKTLTGHIDASQVMTFVYVPFEIEPGTTSLYVLQNYSKKGAGNSLDLGVFDQRGHHIADGQNGTSGFRGWSGGFRNNFTITPSWATPGYNAGPLSPGTWNVILGPYGSVPEGIDWQLDIEMGFEPIGEDTYYSTDFATINMDMQPMKHREVAAWYRGDFHMHTVHSDGRYTPDQQIQNALNRNLSFIFFSEHNTDTNNEIIGAYQTHLAPNLLIGRAIEVTTRHGHWQAIGLQESRIIDWRYHPGDTPGFPEATEIVHRAGGIVSVNHPFQLCDRCNWTLDWDHNDAIEVWNGPWDPTDEISIRKWQSELVAEKLITGIGGSDAHSFPDVLGLPTTVVKTLGRSQAAIIEAVKYGRAYLLQGPGMDLSFTVKTHSSVSEIGDIVAQPQHGHGNGDATAILSTGGLHGMKACFVSDKGYFFNKTISGRDSITRPVPSHAKFVRVEVRNSTGDAMLALTNPIWFS
ncbi:PHP domain protein [Xylogone sp. PMI_703]|nr:PHP domain protein [Xylogone sp. PMI_703]